MLPVPFVSLPSAAVKGKGRFPRALQRLRRKGIDDGTLLATWDALALAMAKTAILKRAAPPAEYGAEAAAFRAHYQRHFVPGSLHLRWGRADYYKDAERAIFAGRFGEGLGYLFARVVLGYRVVAHVEHCWDRLRMRPLSRRVRRPDFVLGAGPDLALAEMKGGLLSLPSVSPARMLRDAHRQCDALTKRAGVPVSSTHAIATLLQYPRDGSFVCHADPEEAPGASDFPAEAWEEVAAQLDLAASLHLAGFEDLAAAVREPRLRGERAWATEVRILFREGRMLAAPAELPDEGPALAVDRRLVEASIRLVSGDQASVRGTLLNVRPALPRQETRGAPVTFHDEEMAFIDREEWLVAQPERLE